MKVDFSDVLTEEDQEMMVKSVDQLIENGVIETSPYHPKYQTRMILFNNDSPKVWLKLRNTFLSACDLYIQQISDLVQAQESLVVRDVHAWCYKGWKSLNEKQVNPWHNHNPALLTGVFYLKIPGKEEYCGTELGDPRFPERQSTRNFITKPDEFSWSIFPGWLNHRSVYHDSEEPRYVIAANAFMSPNHEYCVK